MATTYIYIDNFRGFSDSLIPLRQVNFLVGENSTGKTSFLELVDTLSDMNFWAFEPRYGSPDHAPKHFLDLVSASSRSKKQFTIGAVEVADVSDDTFGAIVTYANADGRPVPERVSVVKGSTVRTVHGRLWRHSKNELPSHRKRVCTSRNTGSAQSQARTLVAAHKSNAGLKPIDANEDRVPAPLYMRYDDLLFEESERFAERELKAPYPLMGKFVELAPIRTKPRRTYDSPQTEFSPEGDHIPYVIRKRLSSKTQADAFSRFIDSAGSSSGLFKAIKLKQYGTGPLAPFELKVVLGKAALGLDNVGYGVSQALPVLVEMFVRPKRFAFTIQQPEVHLHPKAQATFGDLIAELARAEEKRFIVETHSDFTIDRFRLNIRKNGGIPAQLLFFERDDAGNKATSIPISDTGELDPNQPAAYREFFFNESLTLLA